MRKLFMIGALLVSSFLSAQHPIQVKLAEEKTVDEKPVIKGWINGDEYTEDASYIHYLWFQPSRANRIERLTLTYQQSSLVSHSGCRKRS